MTDDGGSVGATAGGGESDARGGEGPATHDAAATAATDASGVDWRGWLLVAVVVVSLLVVPVVVALRPPQLPFRVAFLALPMVPAVLLGATAVWVAVRSRE